MKLNILPNTLRKLNLTNTAATVFTIHMVDLTDQLGPLRQCKRIGIAA